MSTDAERQEALATRLERELSLSPGDARVLIGTVLATYRYRSMESDLETARDLLGHMLVGAEHNGWDGPKVDEARSFLGVSG